MTSAAARGRRILVVAGEASGDRHAGGLVQQALALDPGLQFAGIGGERLRAAGGEVLRDMHDLSVVGVTEVWAQAPQLLRALIEMRRRIRDEHPDGLLLVDFPDFNLHLAGVAARRGVPVVYFVSPQVWAWRQARVRKIRRRVARMIVLFPFEAEFYRAHGVPVTFAGHPLADEPPPSMSRAEARRALSLDAGAPVYGLLPGSRAAEIARLLPPLLDTAREVLARRPEARFLLPVADSVDARAVGEAVARSGLPVTPVSGAFDRVALALDGAVAASGTATLELAHRDVPAVVVYKTNPLTYWIGRAAVHVPFVSLVNLIAARPVLPELLQDEFTPERAADALLTLASPGPARDAALRGLAEVKGRLGPPGAYRRAAAAFIEALDEAAARAENHSQ